MTEARERDYVLGTHDEEIARLALQHRVWRPRVLECWRRAGITVGSRVLDAGAGPGYATVDLAEIVGPTGEVLAVERSARFLRNAREECARRGLTNVRFREQDLMLEPLGVTDLDAAWCRWVAAFVTSPRRLVEILAGALRKGGVAVFHEYADYRAWRLAPSRPGLEAFVTRVIESWRASGGEPDIGLELPTLLSSAGFRISRVEPIVFAISPSDFMWQWPATFIETHVRHLLELGEVDEAWAGSIRRELREAEADPATLMITPLVFEIVAELISGG